MTYLAPVYHQIFHMKVMFSFLAGLFFICTSLAQSSDPAAKQILDKASAKIKSYKSLQVQFTLPASGCPGNIAGN